MSFKCTWPDCDSTFVSNYNLKRHVSGVHEDKRTHQCPAPECNAAFRSIYELKRHQLRVHTKKEKRKCSHCTKTFSSYETHHRHLKFVHGIYSTRKNGSQDTTPIEKPTFICAECGSTFSRKDGLAVHISVKHGDYSSKPFICHHCGGRFARKHSLKTHIFTVHSESKIRALSLQKHNLRCVLCEKTFLRQNQIRAHYVDEHDVDLNTKTLSFSSVQEFLKWKEELEDSTITTYRLQTKNRFSRTYACHRSGTYTAKSSGRKRAPLLRGSKKLNGVCPASIVLHVNENDSSCVVTFTQTHVGHSPNDKSELKFTFIRKEDREKMAGLVASGISRSQIVHDQLKACNALLRDFTKATINRNDLLTNKDLWNIESSFNVRHDENFAPPHQDDFKNVQAFLDEFKDSILFYKRDGESCPKKFSDCRLKEDDLVFVFMCPSQEKMLRKRANDTICVDGTQSLNINGFVLCSLVVLDYDSDTFPAAFMLSNRNDKMSVKVFLRCVREKLGEKIIPRTLVSDVEEGYYDAWMEEMGQPEAHYTSASVNPYTHLQCFLHTLKYLHGCGKKVDLYSGQCFIVNYIKQKMRFLLRKLFRGMITPRLLELKKAHAHAVNKGEILIHRIDEGWLVPSFQPSADGCEEMYVVRKIRHTCPAEEDVDIGFCYSMCAECGECAHKYSCTCKESDVRSLMCKHIHAVLLLLVQQQSEETCEKSDQQSSAQVLEPPVLILEEKNAVLTLAEEQPEEICDKSDPFDQQSPSQVPEPPVLFLQEQIVADMKNEQLDAQKEELLRRFLNALNKVETKEEYEMVGSYLQNIEDSLEQSRQQKFFFIQNLVL